MGASERIDRAVGPVVTEMAFQSQMNRLSGLKFPPQSLITHWEALKDMPEPLLAAAVDKAQREVSEFPSPKMLQVFADAVRPRVLGVPQEVDRSQPLPVAREIVVPQVGKVIPITRDWNYYCEECNDQGMRSLWCGQNNTRYPWIAVASCGRRGEHDAHEWAEKCPCYEHNPDVQRRIERQRQTARRGGEKE
jgi:hypothetical protein